MRRPRIGRVASSSNYRFSIKQHREYINKWHEDHLEEITKITAEITISDEQLELVKFELSLEKQFKEFKNNKK